MALNLIPQDLIDAANPVINGVKVNINPYRPASGGGFHNNFVFGFSAPITLTPSKPLYSFSITVNGVSRPGNKVVGYDARGNALTTAEASPVGTDVVTIIAPAGTAFSSIRLFPAQLDSVVFDAIQLAVSAPVTTPTPPVTTPAAPINPPSPPPPTVPINIPTLPPTSSTWIPIDVPPLPPPRTGFDLSSIVTVSSTTVDRDYIKDSMRTPAPQNITVTNKSDVLDVNISLKGIGGVMFDPEAFYLPPAASQQVQVLFDAVQLNMLPEGVSTLSTVMHISTNTVVTAPPAPPPPPPLPPPTPVLGVWHEERFAGSPGGSVGMSEATIFTQAPFFTADVRTIAYADANSISAPTTVRWTGLFDFAQGYYNFHVFADDGMRVFVDDNLVLNGWRDQSPTNYNQSVLMGAGVHRLRVEYYNDRGSGIAAFDFAPISGPVPTVPPFTPPPTTPPSTPTTPTAPNTPSAPPASPSIPDASVTSGSPIFIGQPSPIFINFPISSITE